MIFGHKIVRRRLIFQSSTKNMALREHEVLELGHIIGRRRENMALRVGPVIFAAKFRPKYRACGAGEDAFGRNFDAQPKAACAAGALFRRRRTGCAAADAAKPHYFKKYGEAMFAKRTMLREAQPGLRSRPMRAKRALACAKRTTGRAKRANERAKRARECAKREQ